MADTNFNDLFMYVPQGELDNFKKQYSEDEELKSKIIFVEDTHEILVNGKSFGYNYDEMMEQVWEALKKNSDVLTTVNANISLLSTTISNESLVREAKDTELNNAVSARIKQEEERAIKKEDELESSIQNLLARVEYLESHSF